MAVDWAVTPELAVPDDEPLDADLLLVSEDPPACCFPELPDEAVVSFAGDDCVLDTVPLPMLPLDCERCVLLDALLPVPDVCAELPLDCEGCALVDALLPIPDVCAAELPLDCALGAVAVLAAARFRSLIDTPPEVAASLLLAVAALFASPVLLLRIA